MAIFTHIVDISTTYISDLAQERYSLLQPNVLKTPLYLSSISDNLLIKAENLQYTGSFKLRGAASKLHQLLEQGKDEVITASTGNHGLGVATIGRKLGVEVKIFVPSSIKANKRQNLENLEIDLIFIDGDSDRSEIEARKYAKTKDLPFISPYNDPHIIAGQGSLALELMEQTDLNSVERIYITVGGGGLISGIGSVLQEKYPHIKIIGCQPENSPAMYHAVKEGQVREITHYPTLSDGSAGGMEHDTITLPLSKENIDYFILVSEQEIKEAIYLAFTNHNNIIEGAAAVALASFLKDKERGDKKSIVVWCGGNISPEQWLNVIKEINQTYN